MLKNKDSGADSVEFREESTDSLDVSSKESSALSVTFSSDLLFKMVQAKEMTKKTNKELCKEFGVSEKDFSRSLKANNFRWHVSKQKYLSLEQVKTLTESKQKQRKTSSKMSLTLKNVTLTYEAYTVLKFKLGARTDQTSIDSCISDCVFKSVSREMQELLTSEFVSIDVSSIDSKESLKKRKDT